MAESDGISVAPLRTLDDFLMESSRFQVPNLKDTEKWSNRVTQNLLYYQTNYFLTYLAVFALVALIHPTKMFYGMTAVGLAYGLFYYLTNHKQPAAQFKKDHPVLSLLVLVMAMYFIVYLLGSVVVFLLGVLLPILVVFLHASMRLRNLKNKLTNKVESMGLTRTPMGVLLDALGLEPSALIDKWEHIPINIMRFLLKLKRQCAWKFRSCLKALNRRSRLNLDGSSNFLDSLTKMSPSKTS